MREVTWPMVVASIKKSFTLIELLVVVALIGILAAIGLPFFQGFIEDAKEAQVKQVCSNVRSDIESAVFYCSINPDKTLPIIASVKKTPCNHGADGIATYIYQKYVLQVGDIQTPSGPIGIVGRVMQSMPLSSGPGYLSTQYPVAIRVITHQIKNNYIELSCNDMFNPPYNNQVWSFHP